MTFASPKPILRSAAEAFRPPKRVRVSEGAASTLILRQPGGYSGPWSPTETPYMVEPMDMLASRRHETVVFVGPARTGKTLGLLDGWFAHCVAHDPGDLLIVQMTQEKAREYSKIRIDRAIRHSPELKRRMSMRGHDDNTHDKLTKSGMWIKIGWPSATQLASSDYRYVALTDYDRMPDNVDGEGAPYVLAVKRTQTFLSRGMCMVESSPGREYEDPNWKPSTPHEAPPASGAMGIYNRSDRRRWYWPCPDCGEFFEAAPGLSLFASLPSEDELLDIVRGVDLSKLAREHANICCPHCGSLIGTEHKHAMNAAGRWVSDGMSIVDGELVGESVQSSIAGYWLGGVAAAYQHWHSIILRYLQGLREYALSGSDLTLKTTINTDQAMPYLPRALKEGTSGRISERAEDLPRFYVPEWARFLVASVDVQAGKRSGFVVQVHAVGPDMEQAIIDRYNIDASSEDGRRCDPGGYPEDWDALTDRVVNSTYRMHDGRELRVFAVGVDTGGEAGVSDNASAWYQRLRRAGLSSRVYLLKGEANTRNQFVVRRPAKDSRGRKIPGVFVYSINVDEFKNRVSASMRRASPGPTYMHIPSWLPQSVIEEFSSEYRQKNGKWKKFRESAPNEGFDLWVYVLAVCYEIGPANMERTFPWHDPPDWARPLDAGNSQVMTRDERREMKAAPRPTRKRRSSGLGGDDWVL